jgi:toxin secretion/phage lysis holin
VNSLGFFILSKGGWKVGKLDFLKMATGTVGLVWSAMVGSLGLALSVLLCLMALDYITGLIQAWINKEVNSSIGTKGFVKKLVVLILIGSVYLMEKVAFDSQHIGDGITVAYIIIEFISITENAGRMGIWMPQQLKEVIKVLKAKEGDKND